MPGERADIDRLSDVDFGTPPWAPPIPLPPSEFPSRSEVVVVGAGITGLAAALTAAENGRKVAIIERQFGSGATSRSGGIVLGDTLAGQVAGFDDCHEAMRDWITRSRCECDLAWDGCLELARDSALPDRPIDWFEDGRIRVAGRVSGGVLDPAKLQSALAEAAL